MSRGPAGARRRDASRSCLEVTLRHISDAVIVSDGQGLVTLMNPLAEALTGWSGFEASGQRLAHVFPVVSDLTGEPLCLAPTRPDEAAPDWTPVQLIDRQGRRHAVSVRCADIPGTAGAGPARVVLIVRAKPPTVRPSAAPRTRKRATGRWSRTRRWASSISAPTCGSPTATSGWPRSSAPRRRRSRVSISTPWTT
jgi:PAS domain S-box-containing protein